MMIVYKILQRVDDVLYSAAPSNPEIQGIEYPVGILVSNKHPLFVFDTLENLESFHDPKFSNNRFEVWKAEAENCRPIKAAATWRSDHNWFWRELEADTKKFSMPTFPPPKETLVCDSLVLLEKVEWTPVESVSHTT